MFNIYTINQTTLPLKLESLIPETDITFGVNALAKAIPQALFNELKE
jgi:hypothetical protein